MRHHLLAIAFPLLATGCQAGTPTAGAPPAGERAPVRAASAEPVINGTAWYAVKVKAPAGADLRVELVRLDVARHEAIVTTTLEDVAGSPYRFALRYDPARLAPGARYGVRAILRGPDGDVWFHTPSPVPVEPHPGAKVQLRLEPSDSAASPPTPVGSPWDEARARGVAYRGIGNEPGWWVEVDAGASPGLRAVLDYGERSVTVGSTAREGDRFDGRAADGTPVTLRIERVPCHDGMSGEPFPTRTRLRVGDRDYDGCGRFLRD